MKDKDKTKDEPIRELAELRQRIAKLGLLEDEQKLLENTYRDSQEHIWIAFKNPPIVIFNQDRQLRYTWIANPHSGFDPAQILWKTDFELLPETDAAVLEEIRRQVFLSKNGAWEDVLTTIGSEAFYYDLVVEPLPNVKGGVVGYG